MTLPHEHKTLPNETAFPCPMDVEPCYGMTIRQYFAIHALQGILANPAADGTPKDFAADAVTYADALISALNQE